MKFKNYTISFAIFLSLLIFFAPFAVWEIFVGDNLFDSVFSRSLSSLPVSKAGRIMPVSSASADALRTIGGKASAKISGEKISSSKWLWSLCADSENMANAPVFRTDNVDLQKLLGVSSRNYSYADLQKRYDEIYKSASSGERTPFSRACETAIASALEYAIISHTFGIRLPMSENFAKSLSDWRGAIDAAKKEFDAAHQEKREPKKEKLLAASEYLSELNHISEFEKSYPNSTVLAIAGDKTFRSPAEVMLDKNMKWDSPSAGATLAEYSKLLDEIRKFNLSGDTNPLNAAAVREQTAKLVKILRENKNINFIKIDVENIINHLDMSFGGFMLYIAAALLLALGTVFKFARERFWLMAKVVLICAVSVHMAAICARMYIQLRPPVTNLYSSVVFTGALAALISLIMFIKNKAAYFALTSAAAGALSLLVAMNLPYSGDTMGMMRAVLNSNFWLTVHVVTIMVGYCGVFVAGFMAAIRLISNIFEKGDFGEATGSVAKNVYAVLCFALMFSFAGTMLGGIWADMSWGRFWGWDPKENGALMIVLWCAAAIHSKILRLVSDRVFLAFAVIGNIIAAWAWFGVNLMGIGLHSYGFVDGGWKWFFIFVGANALIIPLCFIKYNREKN